MKIIALSLVAACLTAGMARAETTEVRSSDIDAPRSIVVRYSELDLMHEDGARALIGRIGQAAKAVCGPRPAASALGAVSLYRGCVSESTAGAVHRLNAPLVSALYRGDRGSRRLAAR